MRFAMWYLKPMVSKERSLYLLYIVLACLLLFVANMACGKTDYTVQFFTLPKGSKVHQDNWTHMIEIVVSSNHTPITDKSNKDVRIMIVDRIDNILLKKHYNFLCASVKATVEWDKLESLELKLNEVGNEFAKDQYNRKLLKSGPNELVHLSLTYDHRNNIYQSSSPD